MSAVAYDMRWEMSLSRRVGAIVLQGILYGFFTSILLFAMYLACSYRGGMSWSLIFIMVAMYAISTADISLSAFHLFRYLLNGYRAPILHPRPTVLFFITNYALANTVLVYRSYIIWARKRRILVLTILPFLGFTIAGYILENLPNISNRSRIYLWTTFALSTLLALCTSGRILVVARRLSNTSQSGGLGKLSSIMSVIIESGMINSLYLLLSLALKSSTLRAGLSQITGIAATLVILQQSLSRLAGNLDESDSMRSAPGSRTASTPVLDSIFSMAGNTTVPSLIATTLRHASAHVTEDSARDVPEVDTAITTPMTEITANRSNIVTR